MVTSPAVSWLFFKARAKHPYLSHTGRMLSKRQPEMAGATWQVYGRLPMPRARARSRANPTRSLDGSRAPSGRLVQSVQQPEGKVFPDPLGPTLASVSPSRTSKHAPATRIFRERSGGLVRWFGLRSAISGIIGMKNPAFMLLSNPSPDVSHTKNRESIRGDNTEQSKMTAITGLTATRRSRSTKGRAAVRWLTTQRPAAVGRPILNSGKRQGFPGRFIRTFRSSPPGQNQGTGGDEESAYSFASRQALVQKQDSKGHGHDHAELVDRCNL
jgi:hypothetical protein